MEFQFESSAAILNLVQVCSCYCCFCMHTKIYQTQIRSISFICYKQEFAISKFIIFLIISGFSVCTQKFIRQKLGPFHLFIISEKSLWANLLYQIYFLSLKSVLELGLRFLPFGICFILVLNQSKRLLNSDNE